jgi:hypothetical protein
MGQALAITRGEKRAYVATITSDGVAVNLTSAVAVRFTVRSAYPSASLTADTDALFTKSVGSGIVLTTPASGIVTITVDKADTNSISIDDSGTLVAYYGLEYIASGESDPKVAAQGTFTISADVVRG